jgi:hypothetical protein
MKDGRLLMRYLPLIWREYPPETYPALLNLLQKFEILHPLDDAIGTAVCLLRRHTSGRHERLVSLDL